MRLQEICDPSSIYVGTGDPNVWIHDFISSVLMHRLISLVTESDFDHYLRYEITEPSNLHENLKNRLIMFDLNSQFQNYFFPDTICNS